MAALTRSTYTILTLAAVLVVVLGYLLWTGSPVTPSAPRDPDPLGSGQPPHLLGRGPADAVGSGGAAVPLLRVEGSDAELEAMLSALSSAIRDRQWKGIRAAMAAIAEDVCKRPERVRLYLRAATSGEVPATVRLGSAVIGALGRCGQSDVLRAIADLLERDEVAGNLRIACIMSLAQRRETIAEDRAGASYQWEFIQIDSPIQEQFVRDLFVRLVQTAAAKPDTRSDRPGIVPLCFALGAVGSEDPTVLDFLISTSNEHRDLRLPVLYGLQLAGSEPRALRYATETMISDAASDDEIAAAAVILARSDPSTLLEYLTRISGESGVAPERVLAVLGACSAVPSASDELLSRLESACIAALRWARANPVLIRNHRAQTPLPPGAPDDSRRPTAPLVYDFIRTALRLTRGRSNALPPLAAESILLVIESVSDLADRDLGQMVSGLASATSENSIAELLGMAKASRLPASSLTSLILSAWTFVRPEFRTVIRDDVEALMQQLPESQRAALRSKLKLP